MPSSDYIVYIVDDDIDIRKSLNLLFKSVGMDARLFDSAVSFLSALDTLPIEHACIVADVRMPGMTGIELLAELKRIKVFLPFVIISGHGDIPMAIKAIKDGAIDFLTKPFDENELIDRVNQALRAGEAQADELRQKSDVLDRYAQLTDREREVMQLVVNGSANKVIAIDLGITQRTVELHRAKVMKKMAARTFSDLVKTSLILVDDG